MTDINWGLLGRPVDLGAAARQGFEAGRVQSALGALARDSRNVDALADLTTLAPEQAYRFQAERRTAGDYARREQDYARADRFRNALANYMVPGAPSANALAPAMPGMTAPDALAAPTPGKTPPPGPRGPQAVSDPVLPGTLDALVRQPDEIVVQGRRPMPMPAAPRGPGGDGWGEVVRADPQAALAASHDLFGSREEHLKDWQHVSSTAMRLMGSVRDQDSWDQGKETARRLYESYGVPFPDNLPDEYSPEVLHDLQMQQLDFDDQIRAALAEKKFDWQRQDDLLDNKRQDRDTDSRISDRNARRALTRRGQDITDDRGRYGIRVASEDRRRGQDKAEATAIRGQDKADARGRRGRRGAAPPAPAGPTPGAVIGGYRFKGGDPANRGNWEQVR